jgi:hypothetical protein
VFVLLFSVALAQEAPPLNPTTAPSGVDEYAKAVLAGRQAADMEPENGFLIGGVASGVLCGAIGCLTTTAIGAVAEPKTPYQYWTAEHTEAYKVAFHDGYEREKKKRRATQAFIGGALGTAAFTAMSVAIYASSY